MIASPPATGGEIEREAPSVSRQLASSSPSQINQTVRMAPSARCSSGESDDWSASCTS
ncbi:MAG: hypothetical protein U1F37_00770 [Alphaproteobacteria bacterium]